MSRRIHMQTADKPIQSHKSGRYRRMCHRWRPWEPITKDASVVTCPRCIKLLAEQVSDALEESPVGWASSSHGVVVGKNAVASTDSVVIGTSAVAKSPKDAAALEADGD